MADLAVWLLQQTALDLLLRPFSPEDTELIEEGLPAPMLPGGFVGAFTGVSGQLQRMYI